MPDLKEAVKDLLDDPWVQSLEPEIYVTRQKLSYFLLAGYIKKWVTKAYVKDDPTEPYKQPFKTYATRIDIVLKKPVTEQGSQVIFSVYWVSSLENHNHENYPFDYNIVSTLGRFEKNKIEGQRLSHEYSRDRFISVTCFYGNETELR